MRGVGDQEGDIRRKVRQDAGGQDKSGSPGRRCEVRGRGETGRCGWLGSRMQVGGLGEGLGKRYRKFLNRRDDVITTGC